MAEKIKQFGERDGKRKKWRRNREKEGKEKKK